ncbi:MAG: ABC transporter permease [Actinomycetota bacterium]|nr:ABC transporter permease [Actinomycetota bacterium]
MTGYIFRRLFQAVVVLLGVTIIAFSLQHMLPGNLARAVIGNRATPLQIAQFDKEYGLNKPLDVQYLRFLTQLLHGNLGYSYRLNQSVDSILARDMPKDFLLVGTSLVLSVLIAVPVGVAQAVRRNGIMDYVGTGTSFTLYSMPSFWLGLILVAVFADYTNVFPPEAPQGTTIGAIVSDPAAMVLPVATLTLVNFALFSRYMRSSAIESLAQDYVRTARAKGLSERAMLARHVLRNSLIPIATLVGLSLPNIFSAGLVTEYVFNFPGTGLAFFSAATTQDYPVELGVTVLIGLATVVGNLLADLAYAVLDPRVRYD